MSIRAIALAAIAALTLAAPAGAVVETVKDAPRVTDSEALALYMAEYRASKTGMLKTFNQYKAATDGREKGDLKLQVEGALLASIDHLDSLEVRECFRYLAELTRAELEAVADHIATAENPPLSATILSHAAALSDAVAANLIPTFIECAPEVTV